MVLPLPAANNPNPNNNHPEHRCVLRGDTAHVLACLVEENLLQILRRALDYTLRSAYRPEGRSVLACDVQASSPQSEHVARLPVSPLSLAQPPDS